MYHLEIWVLTRMSDPITVAWECALNKEGVSNPRQYSLYQETA